MAKSPRKNTSKKSGKAAPVVALPTLTKTVKGELIATVTCNTDGTFGWEGTNYASKSAVASAIQESRGKAASVNGATYFDGSNGTVANPYKALTKLIESLGQEHAEAVALLAQARDLLPQPEPKAARTVTVTLPDGSSAEVSVKSLRPTSSWDGTNFTHPKKA